MDNGVDVNGEMRSAFGVLIISMRLGYAGSLVIPLESGEFLWK
jgi:hypothetical protein